MFSLKIKKVIIFHSLEVVDRGSDTQAQVIKKINEIP